MPKLPPFDEWKRPWKDDEFDAEKAAKLIYNLHKDKETLTEQKATLTTERDGLQTKVTEFEEKDLSEVERLRKENERLKNGDGVKKEQSAPAGGDDLMTARLEIALEKGLTRKEAMRLAGTTREELESDADDYLEETGRATEKGGEDGGKDGGKEGQAPPSIRAQVTPRTGSKQRNEPPDPDANLDPGALFDKVMGRA